MRKASKAIFHAPINVFPLGEIGMSLPAAGKTLDNLSMNIEDDWLLVDCTYKGQKVSFAVPSANCRVVTLVPEIEPQKPPIKSVK